MPPAHPPSPVHTQPNIVIGLTAVIVTVRDEIPYIVVIRRDPTGTRERSSAGLPYGPFDPEQHRTLELGLRSWVEEQTYLHLGYVEQLYTFGDRGRQDDSNQGANLVSIGYLALTRDAPELLAPNTYWDDWFAYFPWEDWREEKPAVIDAQIRTALQNWSESGSTSGQRQVRWQRSQLCFGYDGTPWDEEKVLERYELLFEAGLVDEASLHKDAEETAAEDFGTPMMSDHRRILATAMGRLRGKLKYRPLVFELMPVNFTLLQLQRTVEAISGTRLHKQNFRRLVENGGLVEGTGRTVSQAVGRPAEQFRFRREVLQERPAPGFRVSPSRS